MRNFMTDAINTANAKAKVFCLRCNIRPARDGVVCGKCKATIVRTESNKSPYREAGLNIAKVVGTFKESKKTIK